VWASYTSAGSARVGGNGRELEPAVNREGHGAAPRGRAPPTPARSGPCAGGAARVPDARGLGAPARSSRCVMCGGRVGRRGGSGMATGGPGAGRPSARWWPTHLAVPGAVERNERVGAAGIPTRGVSRNSIETIAPDGLLRRVDTFSRLAESSAAPGPTPAALFDARGPSSGAHLEKCQSRQSRRLAPSRDAADTLARRTGSPLPVHRRDGLGRDQHACLGCPLRSSKRGHRVRVVFREANAWVVGKTRKR